MAFQRMEPIGMDRMDYYFGMVGASAMNAMRSQKSQAVKPEDLIPWSKPTISVDDQIKARGGLL